MVEFGVLLLADDVRGLGERVRRAEAAGFSRIGIGDSQSLFHELYVCLTVAALNTEKALVGPMVTNPLTRHPAVTAAAIATLDELTGGRAFLGLGTGDSAVHNLGYKPVSRARLRRYVDAVRRLLAGEEVDWEGGIGHTRWVRRPVPIILSAEGPRILKLAGEVADGAVVHTGLSADLVHDSFQRVEDGAKGVGRDPAELELSVFAKCNIDDDPDRAVGEIKMALAASGHHAFRHSLEDKHVPAELEGAVLRLVEEYEPAQHERSWALPSTPSYLTGWGSPSFWPTALPSLAPLSSAGNACGRYWKWAYADSLSPL